MTLSEFTLLGIGGKSLSEENAIETAKVINAVNPEFIRVHHTAFKPNTKLGRDVEKFLKIHQPRTLSKVEVDEFGAFATYVRKHM